MSTEWFYAKGEQQMGPVSLEKLRELIKSGEINPRKDLVWARHMRDWQVACQVEELKLPDAQGSLRGMVQASGETPAVTGGLAVAGGSPPPAPGDIEPGSDPIGVFDCITKGFELVKLNFVNILVVGLVYFGISMVLGSVTTMIETVFQSITMPGGKTDSKLVLTAYVGLLVCTNLVTQVASLFLSLGLTRIALKVISSEPFEVSDLFGEGRLLLRAFGASILYGLAVCIGLLLLIAPGVYIALRYGQYLTAMVDRNLGIMEAFEYSGQITKNNLWRLLGLGVLCFLITLAGLLVCCVGAIFTGPIAWLAWVVAYRWMQSGRSVATLHT